MSDPQEAATPSDPHSAEARAKYPDDYNGWSPQGIVIPSLREGFDAGRVSRDAEVAELKAKIADAQAETIRLFGPPDDAATDSFGALSISLGAKLHAILGSASPHAVDDQMIRTTVAQLMDERDSWSPESVAYALEKAIRLTLDFGSASFPVEGG